MEDSVSPYFRQITENLYEGVLCYGPEMRILYMNPAACAITGFKNAETAGKTCREAGLLHSDAAGNILCGTDMCPVKTVMSGGEFNDTEIYISHKAGHTIPVISRIIPVTAADGAVCGAAEIFGSNNSGILAFRQIEKLKKLAFIDSLTGTGNRAYCEIKIHSKLLEFKKNNYTGTFGLLFADIDRFKAINDTYGHEIGDRALKLAAKTMMSSIRAKDFIGRWGGEEFVIILHEVGETELRYVAEKIRYGVEKTPLAAAGAFVKMTVSIGATLAWESDTLESIISRADKLMYSCKARGRNSVSVTA